MLKKVFVFLVAFSKRFILRLKYCRPVFRLKFPGRLQILRK